HDHPAREPRGRRHLRPRGSPYPRGPQAALTMKGFWRAFRRNRLAVIGAAITIFLALLALAGPLIAPLDPNRPDGKEILASPSTAHLFGTDQIGRDVLSRMLWGGRISLAVGFVSVGISAFIGISLGSLAGYNGGSVDGLIMRLVDLMLVFPRLFLLLAV